MPVVFTSRGSLAPRSVSEGDTVSNTPATSPVPGSTLAIVKVAVPELDSVIFLLANSSLS